MRDVNLTRTYVVYGKPVSIAIGLKNCFFQGDNSQKGAILRRRFLARSSCVRVSHPQELTIRARDVEVLIRQPIHNTQALYRRKRFIVCDERHLRGDCVRSNLHVERGERLALFFKRSAQLAVGARGCNVP